MLMKKRVEKKSRVHVLEVYLNDDDKKIYTCRPFFVSSFTQESDYC